MIDVIGFFTVVIRFAAIVICGFFVLPLQFKEWRVRDGLAKLRLWLLAIGILLFSMNLFTIYFHFCRLYGCYSQELFNFLAIFNAVDTFLISVFAFKIYNEHYKEQL